MVNRPALELPLRSEAMHLLGSGKHSPKLDAFLENIPDTLLSRVVGCIRNDYVAEMVMTRAVENIDFGFTSGCTLGDSHRQWAFTLVESFCALLDWCQHFDFLSTNDFLDATSDIHRKLTASTNDFSDASVKAQFAILHWDLGRFMGHHEYMSMQSYVMENVGLIDQRIGVLSDGAKRTFVELKEVLETPVCLQDGLI